MSVSSDNPRVNNNSTSNPQQKIKHLIIDCSALAYCDYSGASTLIDLIDELKENKLTVYLAACPIKMIRMFERLRRGDILESNIYPTISDAVNQAKRARLASTIRSFPSIITYH